MGRPIGGLTNLTLPNRSVRKLRKALVSSFRINRDALRLVGRRINIELLGNCFRIFCTWIRGIVEYHRLTHLKIARGVKLALPILRDRGPDAPIGHTRTHRVIILWYPRSRQHDRTHRCFPTSLSKGGRT